MRKVKVTSLGFGLFAMAGSCLSILGFDAAFAQSNSSARLPSFALSALPTRSWQTGEALFEKRCGGCHELAENNSGPALGTVYSRRAGQLEGFRYSPALRGSTFVWDEANLDIWLQGPRRMVPGVRMGKTVSSADERAVIIAYLKEVSLISKRGAR